ncbi:MAG: hypothetical protein ACOCRX_08105 [Candidatus Woesearchaeota archaeon]
MEFEENKILNAFYEKLKNNLIRNKITIRNKSILWTMLSVNSKKREKLLVASSYPSDSFTANKLKKLEELNFITSYTGILNIGEYILTAKGIWEIDKKTQNLSEYNLIQFFQEKDFDINVNREPLSDRERVAIFALLCMRKFSLECSMDLNNKTYHKGWIKIFRKAFNFLRENNYLNQKNISFDEFINNKGSEPPIEYIMRRLNSLYKKSGHLFINDGKKKYYLDIVSNENIDTKRLKHAFKLVFTSLSDYGSTLIIGDFCNETANEMAKEVESNYQFINPNYDEIIEDTLKEFYRE